jgi:YggT family protein
VQGSASWWGVAVGCRPLPPPLASSPIKRRTDSVLTIIFELLDVVLRLYMWAVILAAVVSTLASFGVLDTRNRIVWTIGDFLYRLTEPALRPIRNFLPNFGGIDISPLILILIIMAARMLLARVYEGLVTGLWSSVLL